MTWTSEFHIILIKFSNTGQPSPPHLLTYKSVYRNEISVCGIAFDVLDYLCSLNPLTPELNLFRWN